MKHILILPQSQITMNKKIVIAICTIILIGCYSYGQSLQKENYDLKHTPITIPDIKTETPVTELSINSDITVIVTPIANIDNQLFLKVASEFTHIDIGFAYAIHRLETGNGTSELWLQNNNAGGLKGKSGYYTYESQEEGYKELFRLLDKYINIYGRRTVKDVSALWCDEEWSYEVVEIWKEINKHE